MSALHRAMEHRLYRAFPEESHRDMDVDFRGGLNQLVSGGDALVKLLVGFVKRNAIAEPKAPSERNHYDQFGVVNRIDFEPEIVATTLWLGTEHRARLAIIRSDVPHLCVIASYLDFIHEVGHLAFAERRHPRNLSDRQQPLLPLVPIKSASEAILAEIYTNSLSMLLVSPCDPKVMAKHLVVSFSLTTRYGADQGERAALFALFFFQVFVAYKAVLKLHLAAKADPEGWSVFNTKGYAFQIMDEFSNPGEIESLGKEFHEFACEHGIICHDFNTLFVTRSGIRDTQKLEVMFRDYWSKVSYSLPVLIGDVVEVFMHYVNEKLPGIAVQHPPIEGHPQRIDVGALSERLEGWLLDPKNHGVPIYAVMNDSSVVSQPTHDMALIAAALGCALRLRMDALDLDKEFQVPVSPKSGDIEFPTEAPKNGYSEYLVRPKDSFLFCCLPSKRRQRLQRQITLLKTLWHISSKLKANRFTSLIDGSLSKPFDDAP